MSTAEFNPTDYVWIGGRPRRRYAAIGTAAIIHLIVLWAFSAGIRTGAPFAKTQQELQVGFLSPNLGPREPLAPPMDWQFQSPEDVLVPEPAINIASAESASGAVAATAITQKLAPRLDPTHTNERPELPRSLGGLVEALSLQLRIFVLSDGSVANAQVVKSTGEGDIDRLAIVTVQNSWRYLPASVNGKPIDAWMTVVVRFAPI
jgi:TonB family protein